MEAYLGVHCANISVLETLLISLDNIVVRLIFFNEELVLLHSKSTAAYQEVVPTSLDLSLSFVVCFMVPQISLSRNLIRFNSLTFNH